MNTMSLDKTYVANTYARFPVDSTSTWAPASR